MPEIIIDEPTKKLLAEMGFVPSDKDPKDYQIEIEGGYAHVDFRKQDGRRWAKVGSIFVKDPDTIPILKSFKDERKKIEDALLQKIGAKEEVKHDTTRQDSTKDEKDNLLIHAPGKENERIKTSGAESPQKKQTESHENKLDSKIQNESCINSPMGQPHTPATTNQEQQPKPPAASQSSGGTNSKTTPNTPPAPDTPNLYEFFLELVEIGGIVELFADTGFLKSTVCVKTCLDATIKGKKAFVIDTEGKVGIHNKKMLKEINSYNYLPIWDDIVKAVETLGKYDLLIIDSLGFPVSAKAAGMSLNEQGKAWNSMMSLIGDTAKAWAYKNNAIVLFTNQPKSEMMKSEEELKRLNAVGDKVHFAPNVILKAVDKAKVPGHYDAKTGKTSLPETVVTLLSHRIPDFMDDTIMMKVYKQDDNVRIEIPENVRERLKKLKE